MDGAYTEMRLTRRNLLVSAGGAVSGLAVGASEVVDAEAQAGEARAPVAQKLKVVVCGGHPGDPEYGCGGTVARLTALGHEVVLLYLNDGAWPPTPASRFKVWSISL